MPAVANIRVNTQVPFPASVVGSGPITVAKSSGGTWTIAANGRLINTQNPGAVTTDYVLVWDDVAQAWLKVSLANLAASFTQAKTQRSVTSSPINVLSTDQILNVNIASGIPSCTLPAASTRGGLALTFKDVGAHFSAHPLNISLTGGDTIEGATGITLNQNRQAITFVPFADGVNNGWAIE